jgi:hypothetical protein
VVRARVGARAFVAELPELACTTPCVQRSMLRVRNLRLRSEAQRLRSEANMATTFIARDNTRRVDWGWAILAGIIAMVVFGVIEIAFSWAARAASPLSPLVAFGTATLHALMPSVTVGGGVRTTIVGAACLLALGALSGVILAYLVDRLGMLGAAILGAVFGLAMYAVDMYAVARVFPALAELRDWMSALAYVIQGALAAALYKVMTREEALPADAESTHDLRDLHDVRLV